LGDGGGDYPGEDPVDWDCGGVSKGGEGKGWGDKPRATQMSFPIFLSSGGSLKTSRKTAE
jgi:hypothetical protein